jgi:hypothetical protein
MGEPAFCIFPFAQTHELHRYTIYICFLETCDLSIGQLLKKVVSLFDLKHRKIVPTPFQRAIF